MRLHWDAQFVERQRDWMWIFANTFEYLGMCLNTSEYFDKIAKNMWTTFTVFWILLNALECFLNTFEYIWIHANTLLNWREYVNHFHSILNTFECFGMLFEYFWIYLNTCQYSAKLAGMYLLSCIHSFYGNSIKIKIQFTFKYKNSIQLWSNLKLSLLKIYKLYI